MFDDIKHKLFEIREDVKTLLRQHNVNQDAIHNSERNIKDLISRSVTEELCEINAKLDDDVCDVFCDIQSNVNDMYDRIFDIVALHKSEKETIEELSQAQQKCLTSDEFKDTAKKVANIEYDVHAFTKAVIDMEAEVKAFKNLVPKTQEKDKIIEGLQEELRRVKEQRDELVDCITTMANGNFNNESVELFALKTYRGWKYICHNGEAITDFSAVQGVTITEADYTEHKIRLDIKR